MPKRRHNNPGRGFRGTPYTPPPHSLSRHRASKRRRQSFDGAGGGNQPGSNSARTPTPGRQLSLHQQTLLQEQPVHPKRRLPRRHQEDRRNLPVFSFRDAIVEAARTYQTVVLVGETGSGKSTQVPQYLYEGGIANISSSILSPKDSATGHATASAGAAVGASLSGAHAKRHMALACTQPRRVAAITVARRVAEEMGSELGHVVGYSVRFDDCSTERTAIKYVTDGVLLREAMTDPLLSRYGIIVLDEAHERALQTDVLFGLLRRLQRQRSDLRVVVMSATLDVAPFLSFFEDAVELKVPGRTHQVDVYYTHEREDDYVEAAFITCMQIHEEEPAGDILVFLPGREEIETLQIMLKDALRVAALEHAKSLGRGASALNALAGPEATMNGAPYGHQNSSSSSANNIAASSLTPSESETQPVKNAGMEGLIVPMYAALPQEQQLKVFEAAPHNTRKFILATNIAETSVTINGVRYVVDPGKVKARTFSPATSMETLKVGPVSKAQAQQRAGRAGREAPGHCFRLYTEEMFRKLADDTVPEIQRVNLCQVVLQLKTMGVHDPLRFDFLSPPPPAALGQAMTTLHRLSAVDDHMALTEYGRRMAQLPLDPPMAHLLLLASTSRFSCVSEALAVVACLSAGDVFYYPPAGAAEAAAAASAAHRVFRAYEGDLPTLCNVFEAFAGAKKDREWCRRHFVNGRSLARATEIKEQLAAILKDRLNIDPTVSCGAERTPLLRCVAAALFLNAAQRQPAADGRRACYRTAAGSREVFIHPSSTLFGRNPPPACVVFAELVVTERQYMRSVTAVEAAWVAEAAPKHVRAVQMTAQP